MNSRLWYLAAHLGLGSGTTLAVWSLAVLPAFAVLAPAAASRPSEERAALERLALARARTSLWEQVTDLVLTKRLTIGVWAARDVEVDRALRAWIRSRPRHAPPRFYSDQTCDLDLRIDPRSLIDKLVELQARIPQPTPTTRDEVDGPKAARDWPVLWATGMAGSAELTDHEAAGPLGWEDVTSQGRRLARRAAAAEALHTLLGEAGRLKLTNLRRVSEFLATSDGAREALLAALERDADVTLQMEPDQVAVAEARIEVSRLIRLLMEVHRGHSPGTAFAASDFREMALHNEQRVLVARGLASPPAAQLSRFDGPEVERGAPAWAHETLETVGRDDYAAEDGRPQELRSAMARVDGIVRLRNQIEELPVRRGVSVGHLLERHPEWKQDVVVFLSGARRVGSPKSESDGRVVVYVELPLQRLWRIVRRGLSTLESDVARESTSAPSRLFDDRR